VLLAAVFIFLAGGVFGILEGLDKIFLAKAEKESFALSYGVLGFALVAEGLSWVRAVRQTRGEAGRARMRFARFIRESKEPAVKTVVSEDSAAIAGVLLAFAGVGLHQLTGDKVWDGAAAVAIGVLLCYVGIALGRDTKGLLIGEAALPEQRERMRDAIDRHPEVNRVLELLTMYVGPHTMLVAARVDLEDGIGANRIEELSEQIDRELREVEPDVSQVFVDATPGPSAGRRSRIDAGVSEAAG
jgi:cation diffusion facilitator family transporter